MKAVLFLILLAVAYVVFSVIIPTWHPLLFGFPFALIAWFLLKGVVFRPRPLQVSNTPTAPTGFRHTNIALDPAKDELWLRDQSGATRAFKRAEILSIRATANANNGGVRIEVNTTDLRMPIWKVMFRDHNQFFFTNLYNVRERDEWFGRLNAWMQAAPKPATSPDPGRVSFADSHRNYYACQDPGEREAWLVTFNTWAEVDGIDAKAQWERLGGTWPGEVAPISANA